MKRITVPNMTAALKQMSVRLGWSRSPGIDSLQAATNRRSYAALIKVGEDAIFRWQKGTREPTGVNTLKVVYTAAMADIHITDYPYNRLSDMAKSLGFIIFFDLVEDSLWKSELKINDMSWLYDIALGRTLGTGLASRQTILDGAIRTFHDDIVKNAAELKTAVQKLMVIDEVVPEQVRKDEAPTHTKPIIILPQQSGVPQPQPQTHEVGTLNQLEFDQVSAYVTLLLPLATKLSFDNSPTGIKQKQHLRELLVGGKQALFPLSTIINRLCNPRSTQD
ncbi:MAG: hypothetical protein QG551_111 [Patescibacteria group bacterium]|jgi:hypothetical protein|nr:hypothetical protein [Patescibacteria group bacterium]